LAAAEDKLESVKRHFATSPKSSHLED